jgi:hypothetical protein
MNELVVDVMGFLLVCVGAKYGEPRLLRLLCLIAAAYIGLFAVSYYIYLIPLFHIFKNHPEHMYAGISAAFRFENFWKLLGNMILLDAIAPVGTVFLMYFGIKWLTASTGPGTPYY